MGINQSANTEGMADPPIENRELRVVLDITRGGPCVMDDIDEDVMDIDVRFRDGCCNVDATVRGDEGVETKYLTKERCGYCPGKVFSKYGSLPRYKEIREGSFLMETYVSDTETVAEIVGDVRDICDCVSVRSIVSTENANCRELRSIDISELTPKQREAVAHAQALGYYNPDSSISLKQVADQMDVSQSALSQRLQRAEANVLRQITCECSCWPDGE